MTNLDFPNSTRHCEGCAWGGLDQQPSHRRVAFESALTKLEVTRLQNGEEPTDAHGQVPVESLQRHGAATACAKQILSGECELIVSNSDGQLEAKTPASNEGKPHLRIVN